MSIFTETEPRPEGWLEREISDNMREAIGDDLYNSLGRRKGGISMLFRLICNEFFYMDNRKTFLIGVVCTLVVVGIVWWVF